MQLPSYQILKIWHEGNELTFERASLSPENYKGGPTYMLHIKGLKETNILGMSLTSLDVENSQGQQATLRVTYDPQLHNGSDVRLLVAGEDFFS